MKTLGLRLLKIPDNEPFYIGDIVRVYGDDEDIAHIGQYTEYTTLTELVFDGSIGAIVSIDGNEALVQTNPDEDMEV